MCTHPKTVSCPEDLTPLFLDAEKQMGDFFSKIEHTPEHGTLTISGERYILARAATFSVELRKLLEREYGRVAAEMLAYNLGRVAGIKDAEFFKDKLDLAQGVMALCAGPVHFAYSGWAYVNILPESSPSSDEDFYLVYDHPYSFEAEAYKNEGIEAERPVCYMNAGYSSGWCQVAFGVELMAREITCRANGDERCLFVMGHRSNFFDYIADAEERYGKLDLTASDD